MRRYAKRPGLTAYTKVGNGVLDSSHSRVNLKYIFCKRASLVMDTRISFFNTPSIQGGQYEFNIGVANTVNVEDR